MEKAKTNLDRRQEAKETINILLVENDSQDVYKLEKQLSFSEFSFHVERCLSLQEALSIFKLKNFDILFVESNWKTHQDFETFEQLTYFTKRLPVVILTDFEDRQVAVELLRRGAEDYLVKGNYDEETMVRTICYSIERFQTKKRLEYVNEEQKQINHRLQQLAILDSVTQLLNMRGLEQILTRELEIFKRGETSLLFLVIGLDAFKKINHQLGHMIGDIVLKEISNRLRKLLRVSDYVARVEGDEFIVLLPQTRFAEAVRVAEKIRLSISTTPVFVNSGEAVHVTASLGLGTVTEETLNVNQLLAKSHPLLYQSKKAGKNCIIYEGRSNAEVADKLNSVYEALKVSSFFNAVSQQIIDLNDQKCTGYEMLSRSSVKSFEMPDDFFRVCMENDLLGLVDYNCFKACVNASKSMPENVRYHLNLFPSTLIETPVESLLDVIQAEQGNKSYCVEISEQQIIGEPSYLIDAVSRLRAEGVSIAIDDVGFGRSCLESLVLLEPNVVKIDKKWVTGIKDKASHRRSLERFLKVTQVLGAEVIAEGIETAEDLEVLQEMGVAYGQGYYFGKPE